MYFPDMSCREVLRKAQMRNGDTLPRQKLFFKLSNVFSKTDEGIKVILASQNVLQRKSCFNIISRKSHSDLLTKVLGRKLLNSGLLQSVKGSLTLDIDMLPTLWTQIPA